MKGLKGRRETDRRQRLDWKEICKMEEKKVTAC